MIVVAIVAMLAALAIPNLLRSRSNANESVAQSALKQISSACESFRSAQTVPTYPFDSTGLTGANPLYLDAVIFDPAGYHGYIFSYDWISITQFVACAIPISYKATGTRTFAINETGVVRSLDNNAAPVNTEAGYDVMNIVQ